MSWSVGSCPYGPSPVSRLVPNATGLSGATCPALPALDGVAAPPADAAVVSDVCAVPAVAVVVSVPAVPATAAVLVPVASPPSSSPHAVAASAIVQTSTAARLLVDRTDPP